MQGTTTPPESESLSSQLHNSQPLFVSLDDHVNGFKVVAVEFRGGATQQVRLTAPSRRLTRTRLQGIKDPEAYPWEVVALCLEPHLVEAQGERWLDSLTPDSAALVETTAFFLTFGAGTQKKIEAAALAKMTDWASSAPSSASSPADGPVPILIHGAGPSSSCAPPLPRSPS